MVVSLVGIDCSGERGRFLDRYSVVMLVGFELRNMIDELDFLELAYFFVFVVLSY